MPKSGEEYDLRVPRDMAYIFSGAYIPLSCKLIEQVTLELLIAVIKLPISILQCLLVACAPAGAGERRVDRSGGGHTHAEWTGLCCNSY